MQNALDAVRIDLIDLRESLEGYWKGQTDIADRVENWQFNTWRRIEETLTKGV